uniref:Putative secreted protein n=1 Tax=Ixodes ricinus TaxID=34613 RepID=A0A6B0V0Y1_IXORI
MLAISSRKRIMRFLFFKMNGLTTSIHGSLAPNSTRFARFCKHLATRIRLRDAVSDGVSVIRLNCLGFKMAGHRSLRKMKPLTTLVLTSVSWGHLAATFFWRQWQMYLNILGQWSTAEKMDSTTLSKTDKRCSALAHASDGLSSLLGLSSHDCRPSMTLRMESWTVCRRNSWPVERM